MSKLIKTEFVPLTRKLLTQMKSLATIDVERKFKDERAAKLIALLEDEQFYAPHWATAFCHEDGQTYRMNGQHSTTVLSDAEKWPSNLTHARIDRWEVETRQELSDVFERYDQAFSVRSKWDNNNIWISTEPKIRDLKSNHIFKFSTGFNVHRRLMGFDTITKPEDLRPIIVEHNEWIRANAKFLGRRIFSRSAVVAAMLVTTQISQDVAAKFWDYVSSDSHPDKKHPTSFLHKFIIKVDGRARGDSAKNNRDDFDDFKVYATAIHAWNAHCRNTTTDGKVFRDAPLPVALKPRASVRDAA